VSSYSGNTEETLASYERAHALGASILAITKGGKLEQLCKERGHPCIIVPDTPGMPARLTFGLMLIPVLMTLSRSGIIADREQQIREMIPKLRDDMLEEKGKQIAATLKGKIPIIYTPIELSSIGIGWAKQRINEIVKIPAFSNVFPNLTHDEISMYQFPQPNIHTIFFTDKDGNEKTRRRMELSMEAIKANVGITHEVLEGPVLSKLFTSLHLGHWVAYYLALSLGVEPNPVPLQESIKIAMQNTL